jgi:precorrin-4 methylase
LGKGVYLVVWTRPKKREWMDQETYDQMPESLTLRQIEVKVAEPGFRVESLIVVTTLTDAKKYTREHLAELYHKR